MLAITFVHYPAWLLALLIFVMILLFIWIGIGYRKYEIRKGKDKPTGGLGSIETSMLTLLGLLLAFTFGIGISRFDNCHHLSYPGIRQATKWFD